MMRIRVFGGLAIEDARGNTDQVTRPRSLALLAILATAGARGMSRDELLGILWPESAPDRARHALSQTLYNLRMSLGAEIVRGSPTLRLDPDIITSDVDDFRRAIDAGHWADAATVCVGPYLEGFFLVDAPDFERWVDLQRARFARELSRALETLAREADAAGRLDEAARYWLRLARIEPLNARCAVGYMEACAAQRDRAAAIAFGQSYVQLVRDELEADPDHTVVALMARLRQSNSSVDGESSPSHDDAKIARADVTHAAQSDAPSFPSGSAATLGRPLRARWPAALVATVLVSVGAAAALSRLAPAESLTGEPVLAVGDIRDLTTPNPGESPMRDLLADMLATNLGRIPGLQVVSTSRMLELMPHTPDPSRTAITGAARRAGATQILEGELIPDRDGQFRLQVRRVDLARGLVRGTYRITGSDRLALFDTIITRVGADLGTNPLPGSLAQVSTRSTAAYRFYEEGLHAFYRFDIVAADRLFRAAIREDSTFAIATYYAWRTAVARNDTSQGRLVERSLELASHAPERDRLLIRAHVSLARLDAAGVAAAESLAVRYPRDPEAIMRAAQAMPDRALARALLLRSIAIDSAAGVQPGAICRMCEAFMSLQLEYQWADSMAAAEATLRRWIALRPEDPEPWWLLADLVVGAGRKAEATRALDHATSLGYALTDSAVVNLVWALRRDDFDWIDRQCPALLASAEPAVFPHYRWYCVIALRNEGRYRDALALIHDGRIPGTTQLRRAGADSFHVAILAMETGHTSQAFDVFRALADASGRSPGTSAGTHTRNVTWLLTLAATAAIGGGDTARAAALVDSIEQVGRHSLYRRDPRLHWFVRGLLAARSGRDTVAARELQASIFSPTNGYTRANYELAHVLTRLGRQRDAIPLVRAALHGGIEGSGLYVTRAELHELQAQLFDAIGQADSAAAHYAIVERAWRSADPTFKARHDRAAQRLAALRH